MIRQTKKPIRKLPNKKIYWYLIIIVIIIVVYLLFFNKSNNKTSKKLQETYNTSSDISTSEPQFKKQGELLFLKEKDKNKIKKIDIEIADNVQKRMQGLMYRSYMPDSAGMLFIFDDCEKQSFWMKNTIISLDIIFINEDKQIVTIQKFAEPYSKRLVPSFKDAMYVLEVNAGFCEKYDIGEGYFISFKRKINTY